MPPFLHVHHNKLHPQPVTALGNGSSGQKEVAMHSKRMILAVAEQILDPCAGIQDLRVTAGNRSLMVHENVEAST